ncbi:phage baseplate protein [Desulfitobacterium sp.]|uniref:phage baseplate protein n=1 Tax=Desulfitobacterium sp. TaxID=49981 RepID=UPI002B208FE3|nr:hypothetical protein [Desulfitobacterium sp.]MEA4901851.1 hypothetical protein [Desulfitobacterium sp.]
MAYTIQGRKSGTVRFTPDDNGNIQTESLSLTSKVTSNPVESGSDITDHIVNETARFSVSGTIIGGEKAVTALKNMRDKRDILTYTGRSRISNLVITSLSFDYNAKNKDGCAFRAQFQEIIIASSERVEVGEMPLMTQQDAGKSSNKQSKKTANAGTKTIVTQTVSGKAYANYVNSYKGNSNSGPATRKTPSYSGVK